MREPDRGGLRHHKRVLPSRSQSESLPGSPERPRVGGPVYTVPARRPPASLQLLAGLEFLSLKV